MRTTEIEINGEKHMLCFNLWALSECIERYGGVAQIDDALKSEDDNKTISETLWLLNLLMRGGELYCRETNKENTKPLSVDRLKILCGAGTIVQLKTHVIHAISVGMTSGLEVEGSKNFKTTQAE